MSATSDFYLARADENERAALQANLENVRDRYLRAEAAWRALAHQSESIESERKRLAADKSIRSSETDLLV
ncbi:MAG: hypothetical protein WC816_00765 [Sphingomonas sp.]|jgi:hypothetical protein